MNDQDIATLPDDQFATNAQAAIAVLDPAKLRRYEEILETYTKYAYSDIVNQQGLKDHHKFNL